jgi:hypothetical protein
MANYSLSNLADRVLLWLHGRRFGIIGDAYGSDTALTVLDGIPVGSSRSGPNAVKAVFTGLAAAGSIVFAGAQVGDSVEIVVGLNTPGDASASFESTISVAGHIQQTSASNLSAVTYLGFVQPQS